jgi:uncharacterized protein
MKALLLALAAVSLAGCASSEKPAPAKIAWQPWSEAAFDRAKIDRKLVLLDLGAVWCHWCHVMDKETYGNPEIAAYMDEHFVAIHVNQDERPDLANRYEDYGWPATILFTADGTELGKFRGFMPPKRLLALLEAFVADPTPGPSAISRAPVAAADPVLPGELDESLHRAWESAYDRKEQGWGDVLKYLDADSVELAMAEGRDDLARGTLDANLSLIDPVWGGVYQYSHGGVWSNPHFEKIMSFQAEDMRIYALAYRVYGDAKYLRAAKDIEKYLLTFLRSPEGAFYASQDADLVQGEHGGEYFALDDAGRRAKGMPHVDKHRYARENGWASTGLASLGRSDPEGPSLPAAKEAVRWTIRERKLLEFPATPGSLVFSHNREPDINAGFFMADNIAMARALFELHAATQDPEFLQRCKETLRTIGSPGLRSEVGFATSTPFDTSRPPLPQVDENISLVRLAIRVFRLTGETEWKELAEHGMKYLAGVARDANGVRAAGILLAAREFASDPVSVVVVGPADDSRTGDLLRAARSSPAGYLVIRRLDPGASEEYMMDAGAPTAYVCTDASCKGPFNDPEELRKAASPPRRR